MLASKEQGIRSDRAYRALLVHAGWSGVEAKHGNIDESVTRLLTDLRHMYKDYGGREAFELCVEASKTLYAEET